MKDEKFGVITFKSTHHALRGESIFKKEKIGFRMIPTPREVTHSCGLSIKFQTEDIAQVKDIVKENKIEIDGVFKIIKKDKTSKAEKLIVGEDNE